MKQIAETNEMRPGDRRSVCVDDLPALLIRIKDEYFVIEDICSHDGQPLTEGLLTDSSIECPRHGAKFNLSTGDALCMPATKRIRTFNVEVRDGVIWAGRS